MKWTWYFYWNQFKSLLTKYFIPKTVKPFSPRHWQAPETPTLKYNYVRVLDFLLLKPSILRFRKNVFRVTYRYVFIVLLLMFFLTQSKWAIKTIVSTNLIKYPSSVCDYEFMWLSGLHSRIEWINIALISLYFFYIFQGIYRKRFFQLDLLFMVELNHFQSISIARFHGLKQSTCFDGNSLLDKGENLKITFASSDESQRYGILWELFFINKIRAYHWPLQRRKKPVNPSNLQNLQIWRSGEITWKQRIP